ncbi:hypothetical protein A6R68_18783 [Neotoma lepida]|uniref:Major facilitator superfamily (MFS) profile domain-containing protein n=1 Tax=Neotoma lepida TaxID=56216 RepID=A0A1A6HKR0_NEOLE|nr:hypothetical protein A6R68_18783 [Neotoma lepida]
MAAKQTEPVTIISLRKLSQATPEPQQKETKTFTVEDAVETIGFGRFHIALFLIMGSTGVVEAMEIMLIAVVSPVIRCEWQLENWQVAFVTTMVFFGYMVSSILFGLLADRYGRWKVGQAMQVLVTSSLSLLQILLLSFLWGAYFSLLTSFSPSYVWFVFLRTMVGCGVSGHAQGLIIKTEFLPTKYRGYMLPLSQVFWLAGSLLIISMASVVIPTIGWRWLIRIASIPGIILIMAFKFIPESARFNVSTGNTQAALDTLESIAKMNRSVMPEGQLVEPILEKRGRFADLLDSKYLRTTLQIWIIWPAEKLHLAEDLSFVRLSVSPATTFLCFLFSAGLIGFLFMLRALVAANFNTIYIYTAEVSTGEWHGYTRACQVYPTPMRALGMGTSGSLCRIGAMVAPFISQVSKKGVQGD